MLEYVKKKRRKKEKENESFKQSETVEKIKNLPNRAAPLAVFSLICQCSSSGLWLCKKSVLDSKMMTKSGSFHLNMRLSFA